MTFAPWPTCSCRKISSASARLTNSLIPMPIESLSARILSRNSSSSLKVTPVDSADNHECSCGVGVGGGFDGPCGRAMTEL